MDSKTGITTSTLSGKKFKIHQSVPSGSVKKGPYAIVRSANLNDGINITRRCGNFLTKCIYYHFFIFIIEFLK